MIKTKKEIQKYFTQVRVQIIWMTFFKTFHFCHHILETFKIRKIRKFFFAISKKISQKLVLKGLVDVHFRNIDRGIFNWGPSKNFQINLNWCPKLMSWRLKKNENDQKSQKFLNDTRLKFAMVIMVF